MRILYILSAYGITCNILQMNIKYLISMKVKKRSEINLEATL